MMKRALTITGAAAAAALAWGAASSASADVSFCHHNGACNIDGENVHFGADDDGDPNVVIGWVQGGSVDVIFTGKEAITTSQQGGGVAWVVPQDGQFFTLEVSLEPGYTFRSIAWRLDAPEGRGPPSAWAIDLFGYDLNDTEYTEHYSGITQDQFFSIVATKTTTRLTRISFTTDSPIEATAQWKIGGIQAVPEPTTWALMIAGFGGAGAMLRRRRAALA